MGVPKQQEAAASQLRSVPISPSCHIDHCPLPTNKNASTQRACTLPAPIAAAAKMRRRQHAGSRSGDGGGGGVGGSSSRGIMQLAAAVLLAAAAAASPSRKKKATTHTPINKGKSLFMATIAILVWKWIAARAKV